MSRDSSDPIQVQLDALSTSITAMTTSIEALNTKVNVLEPTTNSTLNCTISVEVAPTNIENSLTYTEAVAAVALLGSNWRLPTRLELMLMYNNKDLVGGFPTTSYWTGDVDSRLRVQRVWAMSFETGVTYDDGIKSYNTVRAIRTIT